MTDVATNRLSGVLGVYADAASAQRAHAMSTKLAIGAGNLVAGVGLFLSALNLRSTIQRYNAIVDQRDRIESILSSAEAEVAALVDTVQLRQTRLSALRNLRDDLDEALAAGCLSIIRG